MMKNLILGLATAAAFTSASAATSPVATRAALAGNDHLDWSSNGSTAFDTVGTPATYTTVLGVSASVFHPDALDFLRVDEGAGWTGNFGLGDKLLLLDLGANGPISIALSSPVQSIGAQIQTEAYGTFTARLEAFNSANISLGFTDLNGSSDTAQDNSAVFLGLTSTAKDISRFEFSILSGPDPVFTNFALNGVDLYSPTTTPVPEVQTYAMFAGLALLGTQSLRRRMSAKA